MAWLLVLEQLDFVRYYTVTLLSENLFFLLVAATLYLFVRFANRGGWVWLAGAAVCGGLATGTRPTMLLYLPLAILLAAVIAMRRDGWRAAAGAGLLVASLWLVGVAPFTLRNYLVSGTPVLVTAGQGRTFLDYNLPPGTNEENGKYFQSFTGTNAAALKTLLWILWDHPSYTLRNWGHKIGFSLGMTHWMGLAPHPEFVLTSLLYLAAIILVRERAVDRRVDRARLCRNPPGDAVAHLAIELRLSDAAGDVPVHADLRRGAAGPAARRLAASTAAVVARLARMIVVALPAYNEAEALPRLLERMRDTAAEPG